MHVMFFLFSMSTGGAERFTANMANHWSAKGHEVSVVTLSNKDGDGYELDPRIRRVALNLSASRRSLWSALSNNITRVRALNACLRELSPDVVFGIMSTGSVLLSLAQKSPSRVHIGTERSYPPSMPLGRIWETLRKLFYRRLDVVVAQTKEGADWVRRHTSADQVEAIPNPVTYPLPRHDPILSPADHLASGRKLLLAVGRLGPEKGYDRLMNTFAHLAPELPEWDLVIMGEGGERPALEAQRDRLKLGGRVLLPGRAGNVGDWYARADLFALTSLFEGFPNVLVEAMAHGVPAVSVDCNTGPRDVIRSGRNGVLVPQNDPEALRAALHALMSDPARLQVLAQEAVAVRQTFSMEGIAARWEQLMPSAPRSKPRV
ncbi:glycosyltransferase family 4 protein [Tropicibacter sp. Alg240-R139]|uniref:glycosyltransferase family 4 protein n=1 Tax=Tropicibacter sp. Alg240-R139 TaxID=2305991 RepID=UPI0013E0274A|nr:glycosyltransferase family 4 protein [Tropicibacter sp. Alg240-R139]